MMKNQVDDKNESLDWLSISLSQIKKRNKIETEPFLTVFQSNNHLWYENSRLQRIQNDLKQQIGIMQHELSQSQSNEQIKIQLTIIQNQLRELPNTQFNERKIKLDLSKKIQDQSNIIKTKEEEILLSKEENNKSTKKILYIENELITQSKNYDELKIKLELENEILMKRFLEFQEKNSIEINDMNELIEKLKSKEN
jgi:hypothetical protein